MAKAIPGPLIFITGIIVSYVSYTLNEHSFLFKNPYSIFMYIGILMIFYGFVKTLIWYMVRKSNKEIRDEAKNRAGQAIEKRNLEQRKGNPVREYSNNPSTIACPTCGLRHYSHANFCQNCGAKLR